MDGDYTFGSRLGLREGIGQDVRQMRLQPEQDVAQQRAHVLPQAPDQATEEVARPGPNSLHAAQHYLYCLMSPCAYGVQRHHAKGTVMYTLVLQALRYVLTALMRQAVLNQCSLRVIHNLRSNLITVMVLTNAAACQRAFTPPVGIACAVLQGESAVAISQRSE